MNNDAATRNREAHKERVRQFLRERHMELDEENLASYYKHRMPHIKHPDEHWSHMARLELRAWWADEL